jgi:hypothetical protein
MSARPIFPVEGSTNIAWIGAAGVIAVIPAKNIAVWFIGSPIRIVPDSPISPLLPMSMFLLPVVRLMPALIPNAMLFEPVVLLKSAR